MGGIAIDISRVRGSERGEVKGFLAHLDELRAGVQDNDAAICQSLLEALEQDLVSAHLFTIFISWSKSPAVIARCINYEPNLEVRNIAMKELGKHLRRPGRFEWEMTWKALGGAEGLVEIFGKSSVADLKKMSGYIGCRSSGKEDKKREECVEELLRALLPGVYDSASIIGKDRRPVQHHYAKMLCACSSAFITQVLNSHDEANPLFRWRDITRLVRSHMALMRERAINHLFGSSHYDGDVPAYLDHFLCSEKEFAIKALRGRRDGAIANHKWHNQELRLLMPIVDGLAKHRRACIEDNLEIYDLIKLGWEIVGTDRDKAWAGSRDLWAVTFSRWQKWPDRYEDLLRLGLKSGLAKLPHTDPSSYLNVVRRLDQGPRERLLQLCYLDIPEQGLDLFSADNYSALSIQTWPIDLIRSMTIEQQVRLLKKLYQANPQFNFLQASDAKSIIPDGNTGPQLNFNVDLVQENARKSIDTLRKKASAAREQSDRAALAKAAASYAIATGDLDVYGEIVVWQQRFVRDPLTAKVLFGQSAVLTNEGVELVSGIGTPDTLSPESKASVSVLLEDASRGIEKADGILRTFQETYLLAKREPSFQEHDWRHVKELFSAALNSRVSRSETIQRHFAVPRSGLFNVVWKGLLSSFQWVHPDFIHAVRTPAEGMLARSPPEFLAAATRSLLDIGSERRKRQKREGREDSTPIDGVLELMSYEALMRLRNSGKPALASPLIQQTILDRPDASSWHRLLLSSGLLKKLRAEEAHGLLMGLAKGIGEKLEEQSYVRVGESEAPVHMPSQPAVKVTTVKYLAQLLNQAEFISDDAAVEVLIELFRVAQHQDIRFAALDSLLSLLDSLCRGTQGEGRANPTVRNVMAALKTVVPVAGSINERRPLQEADWTEAEATGILPDLSFLQTGELPPLMSVLLSIAEDDSRPGLQKLETEFVEHLILPVLEQSQQEHTRWINMFLAKHNLNATALKDDVPETPIEPKLWFHVLRSHYRSVPKKHLADFNKYSVHRIAPTPAVSKFSASLRADVDLRKSPEVQHWLNTYDRGPVDGWETQVLLELLGPVQDLPIERGVLIDMILQHAKLYLEDYEKHTATWESLVGSLAPRSATLRTSVEYERWHNNRRFIAGRVIELVKDKKKLGQRVMLPSTTKLELSLVHTPGWYKGDQGCEAFVSRLDERLRAMLQEDETCALRWPEIIRLACQVVSTVLDTDEERLRVAYHFGTFGGQADKDEGGASRQRRVAADLVKLEVALELMEVCQNKKKIGDSMKRRVEAWHAHDSDAIRERLHRWKKNRSSKDTTCKQCPEFHLRHEH
ncbi:hypothetical protein KVR01_004342 [Diaporthe batatas]|uniref:uncharacterized protein n=1 Tax=Diaporthe batatas TaxID=748121 RepID=UPI001D05B591|nr:uncharacterized protein KVR01_004342 [Diaporthe batatas]KAG8165790.1 hypothetical protein KVR01_004342 [Diaporthe batatas]